MIPADSLKNIRRIQILSSHMVTSIFAGEYKSVFRGKGIEFEEVREYQPGDDVRCIDWNMTARWYRPFVKRFVEERELTVMFLLDISRSFNFGTVDRFKSRLAAEICALLSYAAIRNNDKVGLLLFSDRIERFIPPKKGNRHVFRIIRDTLNVCPVGIGTDLAMSLEFLNRVVRQRCVLFIISDFYTANFRRPLAVAGRRHDVVALGITDSAETKLSDVGIASFEDAESGECFLVDTSDPAVKRNYRENALAAREEKRKLFRSMNVDYVEITPDISYVRSLYNLFSMRERRARC